MDTATKAKKAAILKMMHAFPSSQDRITADTLAAYLDVVADVGADAVERSCVQFATGRVENRNNAFLPTAAELATNARTWQDAIATYEANQAMKRMVVYPVGEMPPAPLKPLGPIRMEIEGIMHNTSDWSYEEKEEAHRTGKMPKSRTPEGIASPTATKRIDAKPQRMNK